MISRLEAMNGSDRTPVNTIQDSTHHRIGNLCGTAIGFGGALTQIGGYVGGRIVSETLKTAGKLSRGIQGKPYSSSENTSL